MNSPFSPGLWILLIYRYGEFLESVTSIAKLKFQQVSSVISSVCLLLNSIRNKRCLIFFSHVGGKDTGLSIFLIIVCVNFMDMVRFGYHCVGAGEQSDQPHPIVKNTPTWFNYTTSTVQRGIEANIRHPHLVQRPRKGSI